MRMKSYCMSVIIFCGVVFLGTGCSKELSKEEEFKEFVTSELNGPGKEQKVKKFILEHFSFANEEELFFEGEFDTNNVCLSIKESGFLPSIKYSFRLVKDNSDEGYSDGFKVYCTTGETDEEFDNDFKKLAFFLFDEKNKIDKDWEQNLNPSIDPHDLNELKEIIHVANINLRAQGIKRVDFNSIAKRIYSSSRFFLKLKNGHVSPILNSYRKPIEYLDPVDISSAAICLSHNDRNYERKINNYKTDFLEKCEGQQFENCNEPHSTNLFIYYKGTYYGIDQWEKFL